MATTPREAAKINDVNERKSIVEMEAHIDGVLNAQFRTGTKVEVSSRDIRKAGGVGYSARALDDVLDRFRAVGWTVKKKRAKDHYESDYYVFSETANPSDQYKVPFQVVTTTPTQFDVDSDGLASHKQR